MPSRRLSHAHFTLRASQVRRAWLSRRLYRISGSSSVDACVRPRSERLNGEVVVLLQGGREKYGARFYIVTSEDRFALNPVQTILICRP